MPPTLGTAESYRAFTRTWWRRGQDGQPVPGPGRRTTIARRLTREEAVRVCDAYNRTHAPGPLSRKCEFTREETL